MRQLFIILSLLSTSITSSAQDVLMREVFKLMPDTIVPYLTGNNRLDLLDFMDSKMTAEVTNSLAGKTVLNSLSDRHLSLSLNEVSTMEMILLPISEPVDGANQLICMIRTYGVDIRESAMAFFSMKWRPLPSSNYIDLPREMYVAAVDPTTAALTLTLLHQLNIPADEEQQKPDKTLTTFKWSDKYVTER